MRFQGVKIFEDPLWTILVSVNIEHGPHPTCIKNVYVVSHMCSPVFPNRIPHDSIWALPLVIRCREPCPQAQPSLVEDTLIAPSIITELSYLCHASEWYHMTIVATFDKWFFFSLQQQLLESFACQKFYGGLWLNWRAYHFALGLSH